MNAKKRGTFDFPIELYYVDKHHSRYQMPFHWHMEYELIRVLQGTFTLILDGQKFVLSAGDSAWISDGVIHGGTPLDCIYECIVFDLKELLHAVPHTKLYVDAFLASAQSFSGPLTQNDCICKLTNSLFCEVNRGDKGYEWATIGLLCQIIGEIMRVGTGNTATVANHKQVMRLKRALSLIREKYFEPLRLSDLAAAAEMTPKYFCRAFAGMTGRTPVDYLIYYRVERACEKLKLTDDTITDIAVSCGFNDMSYFSKIFKRYKGCSPTHYRTHVAKNIV